MSQFVEPPGFEGTTFDDTPAGRARKIVVRYRVVCTEYTSPTTRSLQTAQRIRAGGEKTCTLGGEHILQVNDGTGWRPLDRDDQPAGR